MPIDDVHFLYRNSSKENIVLLIDSSKRDKTKYRTPSEFVIDFPEPFRNVIGVEVLNAAIPRTTFTVDKHNNKLVMFSYQYEFDENNNLKVNYDFRNKIVQPNDFTSAEKLLSGLTTLFREKDQTFTVEADSLALEADVDITTKGYVKLESLLSPFVLDTRKDVSPLSPLLGFSLHASRSDGTYMTLQDMKDTRQVVFSISDKASSLDTTSLAKMEIDIEIDSADIHVDDDEGGHHVLITLQRKFNCPLCVEAIFVNGEVYDLHNLDSIYVFGDTLRVINFKAVLQGQPSPDAFHFKIKYAFMMPDGEKLLTLPYENTFCSQVVNKNIDDDNPIQVDIDEDDGSVVKFFADTNRLSCFIGAFKLKVEALQGAQPGREVYVMLKSIEETLSQQLLIQVSYEQIGSEYFISCDMSKLEESVAGMNPLNYVRIFPVFYRIFLVNSVDFHNAERIHILDAETNDPQSDSIVNSVMYDVHFKVVPPGIVNMVTENYVILRCPEIENHSRGSYDANDASPGLALFSIDVKAGYAANRNEFFSVKYKEFHPIGKLSRLHFRFERKSDAQLYDFKGVDLHFILSLKMLAAQKLNERELEYSLNPNYDPDYQGFMKSSFENVESEEEIDEKKITDSDFEEEVRLQNLSYQRRINLSESDSSEYDSELSEEEYR